MHGNATGFVLQRNVEPICSASAGGGDRSGQLERVAVRGAAVKVGVERFRRAKRNLSRPKLKDGRQKDQECREPSHLTLNYSKGAKTGALPIWAVDFNPF